MMTLEKQVHEFVRQDFKHQFGKPAVAVKDDPEWRKVRATGTRLWLDTGDIDEAGKLWNSSFEALTTNNTLLNKEIQKGIYDNLVAKAAAAVREAAPKISEQDLILEIAFILNAHHALRLVERFDAFVSVELHTDLASDVERTVAYGKRYFAICPERFYVKVPLTPAGYLGARQLVLAGIPINFTLGFSARHNYLAALLTKPNYVNVFLGRLNSFVADNKLGDGQNVGEKATLATQRETLKLRQEQRTKTNLIAASIRSGAQVGDLAGVDVQTMPTKAAAEYRAKPRAKVTSQVANNPDVSLTSGITFSQFNGETLWSVPQKFKDAVEDLLRQNLDALTPDAVQTHCEKAGLGDFLPRWSMKDIQTATKDGKIPVYATWKERLAAGKIGLDALMNLSALYSFATDQKSLDDRIRSLLK
ncbi:MAG TPA: transaldolase family protein [Verrucomicrobiae bacterium]|nr:transaldolase family protein [Verrucomicrobiae bacterium]